MIEHKRSYDAAPSRQLRWRMTPSAAPTFPLAEAHFKACQHAHRFISERVLPRAQRATAANPTDDDAIMFTGMLYRVVAWMNTLSKLNEPSDFQAVSVASRTLFEIAVDITLMHFDAAGHPSAKLRAWEESSKMSAALKIQAHFADAPPSKGFGAAVRFANTDRVRVQKLRDQHWKGRHVFRWTGSPLSEDAAEASVLFSAGEFKAFYETRFAAICWDTHGSGLPGTRGIRPESFAGLLITPFAECTRHALMCAELVLKHLNLWGPEDEEEFRYGVEARTRIIYAALPGRTQREG